MGYITESFIQTFPLWPEKSKTIPSISWNESNHVYLTKGSKLLKENVSFEEFENIIQDYTDKYGTDGFYWNTTWNNEGYKSSWGEYIDRGFNN